MANFLVKYPSGLLEMRDADAQTPREAANVIFGSLIDEQEGFSIEIKGPFQDGYTLDDYARDHADQPTTQGESHGADQGA